LAPSPSTPRDAHVVTFRLYGDGYVVFAGDQMPLSSGLDASIRIGHLSEAEISGLIGFVSQSGFLNLNAVYPSRPPSPDAAVARVSIYLNRSKTVRVYAPDETTPKIFKDVLDRIRQTIPSDTQNVLPIDAFLQATPAGSPSNLGQGLTIGEWSNVNVHLADAAEGIVVSGSTYVQVAALVSRSTSGLYRDGDQVYRVRFAPNLPRAPHLSDWVGTILDGTREFSGRTFEIVGYYRGANLFDEASGGAPNLRNAWVIADAGGAMYVAGIAPARLDPNSRADAWTVVRLRGAVTYVRSGTSYIQAQRVEVLPTNIQPALTPTAIPPTLALLTSSDAAIAQVKAQYPQVAKIQKAGAGIIGGSHTCLGGQCQGNIFVIERVDGWDLAFWEGWGDCPAGCINNHYHYFSVRKDGRVTKAGEYARIYNSGTNSFDVTGTPMWSVPR
jgi:hypothetical protein